MVFNVRRVISALIQFVRNVSFAVWEAASVIASEINHAAQMVANAISTIWGWWNTYVPRWIRWALYGAGIMFVVYLILGFGVAGVVKGSLAASIQSGIGNVPAGHLFGHLFATMQSLGATGALWKIMTGVGAGVGAFLSWVI